MRHAVPPVFFPRYSSPLIERRPKLTPHLFPLFPSSTTATRFLSYAKLCMWPAYDSYPTPRLSLFFSRLTSMRNASRGLALAFSNEDRLLASSDEFLGAGRRDFEMFRGEMFRRGRWPAKIWNDPDENDAPSSFAFTVINLPSRAIFNFP